MFGNNVYKLFWKKKIFVQFSELFEFSLEFLKISEILVGKFPTSRIPFPEASSRPPLEKDFQRPQPPLEMADFVTFD